MVSIKNRLNEIIKALQDSYNHRVSSLDDPEICWMIDELKDIRKSIK
jgi:hypothetical protein